MSALRQIGAVTLMNLANVPRRLSTSLVIVIGIAGVVGVLVSVLAMAYGFAQTIANTGRPDRAIVLRSGATSEISSSLSRSAALTIMDAPGVKHGADGKPIASADAVTIIRLKRKSDAATANVTLRGTGAQGLVLRPEIRLLEGRMFRPAVHEVIVGSAAQAQFQGLEIGGRIRFQDSYWTVVGRFASDGNSQESELLADAETVLSAYRHNTYQDVRVLLVSPQAFETFKSSLTTNPTLSVEVQRESDYYAQQSKDLGTALFIVGYIVGGTMAIGALFGALNTMYSAVSARSVEIATLRAIGFGPGPVVISVLVESLMLSLLGAAVGASLAWLFFHGNTLSTLAAGGTSTQLVFTLAVSPGLVVLGVVWACVIGIMGGLLPSIHAARLPVATALRAVA